MWPEFTAIAKDLGFSGFVYTIANEVSDDFYYFDTLDLHRSDNPDFYDPFLDFCCNSYEPMYTGTEFIDDYTFLPPQAINFIKQAASKTGMRSGLSIPIRLIGSNRYGGFNLLTPMSRDDFEPFVSAIQEVAHLACVLTQRHVEQLLDNQGILIEGAPSDFKRNAIKLEKLTERERQVLKHLVDGESRKGCAEQMCLAEGTIATHVKNIYRKLGVRNRVQATKIAYQASL